MPQGRRALCRYRVLLFTSDGECLPDIRMAATPSDAVSVVLEQTRSTVSAKVTRIDIEETEQQAP